MPTAIRLSLPALALALLAVAPVVQAQESRSREVPLQKAQTQKASLPAYKVDPFWPKMPLPNKWIIQGVPTMVTDKDDHIWVLNRPRDINPDESGAAANPPRTDCCIAAPAVLEFDTEGNLLRAWGGPGYHPDWPAAGVARPGAGAEHNIVVDREGNVWISGSSQGEGIQKYSADGKFLWDFGHPAPRPPAPRPAEK